MLCEIFFFLKLAYFHYFLLLCNDIFFLGVLPLLIFKVLASLKGGGKKTRVPTFWSTVTKPFTPPRREKSFKPALGYASEKSPSPLHGFAQTFWPIVVKRNPLLRSVASPLCIMASPQLATHFEHL